MSKEYPKTIETFRPVGDYELGNMRQAEPDCFNSTVSIRRYRVTIEEIPEPKEVLIERLRKLWRECNNMHHLGPLKAAAKELGIELDHNERRRIYREHVYDAMKRKP